MWRRKEEPQYNPEDIFETLHEGASLMRTRAYLQKIGVRINVPLGNRDVQSGLASFFDAAAEGFVLANSTSGVDPKKILQYLQERGAVNDLHVQRELEELGLSWQPESINRSRAANSLNSYLVARATIGQLGSQRSVTYADFGVNVDNYDLGSTEFAESRWRYRPSDHDIFETLLSLQQLTQAVIHSPHTLEDGVLLPPGHFFQAAINVPYQ